MDRAFSGNLILLGYKQNQTACLMSSVSDSEAIAITGSEVNAIVRSDVHATLIVIRSESTIAITSER
jgi:hypothetical protein